MNKKLLEVRLRRRLTVVQISHLAQVSEKTYRRWEAGTNFPRMYNLDLLCTTLHETPENLGFDPAGYAHSVEEESKIEFVVDDASNPNVVTLRKEEVETIAYMLQLGSGVNDVAKVDNSRRQAILEILGITGMVLMPEPFRELVVSGVRTSAIGMESLDHFHDLVRTCWKLSSGSEMSVAEQILPTFLPKVMAYARQQSPYQMLAAGIASQGLQLNSILVAHKLDMSAKIAMCDQAIEYAQLSRDKNMLVAAIIQLAIAQRYANQPKKALQSYQLALHHVNDISPLLQARVYVEASESLAVSGEEQGALKLLTKGYEVFPDNPQEDVSHLFADCGRYTLALYNGLTHCELGEYKAAWSGYETINSEKADTPERIRLEIVNNQAVSAISMRDLDLAVKHITEGAVGAKRIDSSKRFDEAQNAYKLAKVVWPMEKLIKDLAPLFH